VRAHRLALQAQRQFWHSMLRDTVALQGPAELAGVPWTIRLKRLSPCTRRSWKSGFESTCDRHTAATFSCAHARVLGWLVLVRALAASLHIVTTATCVAGSRRKQLLIVSWLLWPCRYPANGRLLKVYGRFLEYVTTTPGVGLQDDASAHTAVIELIAYS